MISEGFTPRSEEKDIMLREFLNKELSKFEGVKGLTDKIYHQIRVETNEPNLIRLSATESCHAGYNRRGSGQDGRRRDYRPSRSAWSSLIVIVQKKDGKYKFCVDFRRVKEVTERDAYPLPHITTTLEKLQGYATYQPLI